MTTSGVFYIALGGDIYPHLEKSITSLRAHNPGLPVAIATNCPQEAQRMRAEVVINIPDKIPGLEDRPSYPDQGYFSKVRWMELTPWENTLFLDHDTYIMKSLEPAFAMLDRFDLCAAPDVGRHDNAALDVPMASPMYNTGVLAFRKNEKTKAFLIGWWATMLQGNDAWGDQPSFLRTLWNSPEIQFAPLRKEYNFRFIFPQDIFSEATILHGRHDQLEALAVRLNRGPNNCGRLWYLDRLIGYYDVAKGTYVNAG